MTGLWTLGGALARADPNDSKENIAWARRFFAAVEPFSTGKTNFNSPGLGDEPGFVRAALGENWSRLVEIKRKSPGNTAPRGRHHVRPAVPRSGGGAG